MYSNIVNFNNLFYPNQEIAELNPKIKNPNSKIQKTKKKTKSNNK